MSDIFEIKRGDTSPELQYALEPTTVNLTAATVRGLMRDRSKAKVVDAAATIVTATGTPTVKYSWVAIDTAIAGDYEFEFQVTYSNGKIETFPNSGFIPVRINEDVS